MVNNKMISMIERECIGYVYDEIIIYFDNSEKEILSIENSLNEYVLKITSHIDYYKEKTQEVWEEYDCVNDLIDDSLERCLNYKLTLNNSCSNCFTNLMNKALSLATNQKDFNIIKFRIVTYNKNIIKSIESFTCDIENRLKEIIGVKKVKLENYILGELGSRFKSEEKSLKEEYYQMYLDYLDEEMLEKEKTNNINDIYDYKLMIKYAMDNGFKYKWSKGSHNIYEHNKTNKIVVIPSHSLGKGLSREIQKQIENNSK